MTPASLTTTPRSNVQTGHSATEMPANALYSHLADNLVLTCLVFFFPKFLMYMSYSFTGGRSRREKVKEKSRSISRSSFVLRVLETRRCDISHVQREERAGEGAPRGAGGSGQGAREVLSRWEPEMLTVTKVGTHAWTARPRG